MEAAHSEDDDGSDSVSVQLHLQGPHPVPAQLPADLSAGCLSCRRQEAISGWTLFQVYAKLHSDDEVAVETCFNVAAVWWSLFGPSSKLGRAEVLMCGYTKKKDAMPHEGA